MVIGIDLDGVVCDFIGSLLRMEGREELQGGQQDYYFPHKGDCAVYTEEQFMKAWDEFNAQHGFIGIKMISGAFDGIEELLKKKFEIVFITDRKKESFRDTWYWMRLMGWYDKIPVVFSDGQKVERVLHSNIDILVDDSLEILKGVYEEYEMNFKTALPVCFNQTWNSQLNLTIPRFYDWEALIEFIVNYRARKNEGC